MIQDKIFEINESDNWFLRNSETLLKKTKENDLIFGLIEKLNHEGNISSALELGASNGYRLNFLKESYPQIKKIVGVDLSNKAVDDGTKRYNLELYKNSITDFRYNEQFDLVIINFVYHWVDRANIFKAISNTDSFVKDGGYLIIGDFLPDFPQKNLYHHRPEDKIYTYKLDYSKIFTSLSTYKKLYELKFNTSKEYDGTINYIDSNIRACCTILKKDLNNYYKEEDKNEQ